MISLKDIAQICDVSESTVSKALKQRPEIKRATRERIMSVARQYNYQPNAMVESIQTGRSRTIGIAYNNFTDSFAGEVMSGIIDCLHSQGYDIMVICWDKIVAEGTDVLSRFSRRRVDGLLIFPMAKLPSAFYQNELRSFHNPVVVIDQTWQGNEFSFVGSNHRQGALMATEYMISRGIANIGCIYCSQINSGQERYIGYQEAMARHGVAIRKSACLDLETRYENNYDRIRALLEQPERPEGLICFNDYCALEVNAVAYDLGIAIPEQLSLIGFGNLPLSSRMRPRLTTVEQFSRDIGNQAARQLIEAINTGKNGVAPQEIRMPVELVVRDSVR